MNTIQDLYQLDTNQDHIYLAGGCFWGTEAYLGHIEGVDYTSVGYANGTSQNPTYEQVCQGDIGFVEAVYVVFDTQKINLEFLLDMYFESINPVSKNKQGNDVGVQYRTGIYYLNESHRSIIDKKLARLQTLFDEPIAVEAMPIMNYYTAETYHQKYLEKNPNGYCHIPASLHQYAKLSKMYTKPDKDTLRERLSDLEFDVTQNNATERPFVNKYDKHFEKGIYVDITTKQPLFISTDKFEAGCGWPSFSKPIHDLLISKEVDASHGMNRTEVRSRLGEAHLGHVFNDGPKELGGLRYCINSASLEFVSYDEMEANGYGSLLDLFD